MAWDPNVARHAERVYLGNDGGIYHSDGNGSTARWVHATYEPWNQGYHLAVAADDANRLATGLQDNGSNRTWTPTSSSTPTPPQFNCYGGGDGHYVAIDQSNDNDLLPVLAERRAAAASRTSRRSRRRSAFGSHGAATRFTTDAPLVLDPTNPAVVYLGGNVLDRSLNRRRDVHADQPARIRTTCRARAAREEQDPAYANTYATITAIAPGGAESRSERLRQHDLCRHRHRPRCGRRPTPAQTWYVRLLRSW